MPTLSMPSSASTEPKPTPIGAWSSITVRSKSLWATTSRARQSAMPWPSSSMVTTLFSLLALVAISTRVAPTRWLFCGISPNISERAFVEVRRGVLNRLSSLIIVAMSITILP